MMGNRTYLVRCARIHADFKPILLTLLNGAELLLEILIEGSSSHLLYRRERDTHVMSVMCVLFANPLPISANPTRRLCHAQSSRFRRIFLATNPSSFCQISRPPTCSDHLPRVAS